MLEYTADFLVTRPSDQRVWVVRASGGTFVRHFQTEGAVAIGHLNELPLNPGPAVLPPAATIAAALRAEFPDRTSQSISSHANQAFTFATEIKENDLVVTLDSESLMVGRVIGDAYIDNRPIVLFDYNDQPDEMPHTLRRPISWGPRLSRKSIPNALEMTLLAHQTVFNLDKHWAAVYHLMYPYFLFENKLYLSANIKQKEDLENYSIAQLFSVLSGIEAMANTFSDDSWKAYPRMPDTKLTLTSKAEFMSPGTIWSVLDVSNTNLIWVIVIYIMVFGGNVVFFKTDGIIDKETKRKILDRVLKLKDSHDFERVKKKLKVDMPKHDTTALEIPQEKRSRKSKPRVEIAQNSESDRNT